MKIICVTENADSFAVHSKTGNQYHIRYAGSGDGDPEYIALWECDCPASKYGRECKHIRRFLNSQLVHVDEINKGDSLTVFTDGMTKFEAK